MNISDVKLKTGLSGENIRFYQEKKLIQLSKDRKGRVNYTDETVDTLLKIKLLRYLKISIKEIRKLQQSKMTLKQVLHQQMQDLSTEDAETASLHEICRHIYEEGCSYERLHAKKYLNELAEKQRNPKANAIISAVGLEDDSTKEYCHPWLRFFARCADYAIYTLLLYIGYHLILGNKPNFSILFQVCLLLASTVLMFIVEPMLLSTLGTTPGKWLLGISITRNEGGKLSYRDAFWRTVKMFQYGQGYHIPLYNLYCYWCCREDLQKDQLLLWDEKYNCAYHVRGSKIVHGIAYILVAVAILIGETAILSYAELPRNKGNLSLEEFAENYNDYLAYEMPDYYIIRRLDHEGRWCKAEGLWSKTDGYAPEYIESIPEGNYLTCPKFIYTEEDGILKEISLHYEIEDPELLGDYNGEIGLAILSYACAQPGIGLREMNEIKEDLLLQLEEDDVDFTYTIQNIDISCKIENNLSDFYSVDFSMKAK